MIVKDKIALVTGASEGIGLEIAKQLAKAGATVIGVSRNIESSDVSGFELKNCDISDSNQVNDLFKWIKEKYNTLDILVNNAGVWQKISQADEVSEENTNEIIDTNLKGTIFTAQAGQSIYTAAKYGVKGFTDVLREDLKDSMVHVMAVYQAGTDTEMFRKAGDNFGQEKFTKPEDLAAQIVNSMNAPDKLWVNELHVGYR